MTYWEAYWLSGYFNSKGMASHKLERGEAVSEEKGLLEVCKHEHNEERIKLPQPTEFYNSLIFVVSLVGNSFIGIVVYKTQTLRKPINYFIVNMAISDLLYPIIFIPWNLTYLLLDMAWLIGGPLGQAWSASFQMSHVLCLFRTWSL